MGWAGAAVLISFGMFLLGMASLMDGWLKRRKQTVTADRGLALQELEFVIRTLREEVLRADNVAHDLRNKLDECTHRKQELERRAVPRD